MRIVAIPYAAGTAFSFRIIQNSLKPSIKLDVFEYPGHGQKMGLPLLNSIQEIAQDMLEQMFPIYEPYSLLGYSMGGHVLCELYRLLRDKGYPLPVHVFLCAIDIPKQSVEKDTDLSDQALKEELEELGGTAPEILENPEFMEMLLPIYRADYMAEKNYVLPYERIFQCEGTVIVGKGEIKDSGHFTEWNNYFFKPVRFCEVEGGHFFMLERPLILSSWINQTVTEIENGIRSR